jgi:hypothetical protein
MGVLGEMFPGPKIRDESGEEGDGQQWRLGPIDLDNRTVQVQQVADPDPTDDEPSDDAAG